MQRTDSVAGRQRANPASLLGNLGQYFGHHLLCRWVRGVLQAPHLLTVVVIADHADESDDCSGGAVAHQLRMFGWHDGLLGERGPQDQRAGGRRRWSPPASWSKA